MSQTEFGLCKVASPSWDSVFALKSLANNNIYRGSEWSKKSKKQHTWRNATMSWTICPGQGWTWMWLCTRILAFPCEADQKKHIQRDTCTYTTLHAYQPGLFTIEFQVFRAASSIFLDTSHLPGSFRQFFRANMWSKTSVWNARVGRYCQAGVWISVTVLYFSKHRVAPRCILQLKLLVLSHGHGKPNPSEA